MTRSTANALLLLAAFIWGIAFLFQKTAMNHVGAMTFVAGRSFIACLVLAPIALWFHRSTESRMSADDTRALAKIGVIGGVFFFLGAIFQQVGLITATVSNTGFLTGLYVVFTPLIALVLWRSQPPAIVWPAAGVALIGTYLLGGGALEGFGHGDFLVSIGAIFWAAHMLATGGAARYKNAALFTTVQFFTVGCLGLIGAVATETITLTGVLSAWKEFLFVGLLSSALTFTLLTIAMKHADPSEAAIIVSLETVVAAIAAYLVLSERLTWIAVVGAGLMFLATVMIQVPKPFERLFGLRNASTPR
jgi:drug/metabolite transporter (DMT)-like permease